MSDKKKVLLGMSGGVDSSVAAILLKQKGYEVVGITMKLWEDEKCQSCNSLSPELDAKKVCDKLGIKHYVVDLKNDFKEHVINDFIAKYVDAKTPNPCIECNKFFKFGAMYEKAKELGIEYIATGHYAKVEFDEKYNRYVLKKSASQKKDQSYVLYSISKDILPNVIFPLNEFENKDDIRKIAKDNGLDVASKSDSQDICFIPDNDYMRFLNENMTENQKKEIIKSGEIVDVKGNIRKTHEGIIKYTIGQRKGLGIQNPTPLYVLKLDKEKNQVLVGEKEDTFSDEAYVEDVNLLLFDKLKDGFRCKAKVRYAAKEADCTVYNVDDNNLKVIFDEKQMAITPGQSIVFYLDDIVVGGGKICK